METNLSYVTRYENILISVAYKNYEQTREYQGTKDDSELQVVGQTLVTSGSDRQVTEGGTIFISFLAVDLPYVYLTILYVGKFHS